MTFIDPQLIEQINRMNRKTTVSNSPFLSGSDNKIPFTQLTPNVSQNNPNYAPAILSPQTVSPLNKPEYAPAILSPDKLRTNQTPQPNQSNQINQTSQTPTQQNQSITPTTPQTQNKVVYQIQGDDGKTYLMTVDYSKGEVKHYEVTPSGLVEKEGGIRGRVVGTYEVTNEFRFGYTSAKDQKGYEFGGMELRPISRESATITNPEIRRIVNEVQNEGIGGSILRSIPFVSQVYHAYKTHQATQRLGEILEKNPELAREVYKASEIIRETELKKLGVDTATGGAMILTAGVLGATNVAGNVAGRVAGSVGSKMAIQGAIEGAVIGTTTDITKQTTEIALKMREKYEPTQTLVSAGIGAVIGTGIRYGQYQLSKALNKPEWIAEEVKIKEIDKESVRVIRPEELQGKATVTDISGKAKIEYLTTTRKGIVSLGTKEEELLYTATSKPYKTVEPITIEERVGDTVQILTGKQISGSSVVTHGRLWLGDKEYTVYALETHKTISQTVSDSTKFAHSLRELSNRIQEKLGEVFPKFKDLGKASDYLQKASAYARSENIPIEHSNVRGLIETKANVVLRGGGRETGFNIEGITVAHGGRSITFYRTIEAGGGSEMYGITALAGNRNVMFGLGKGIDPQAVQRSISEVSRELGKTTMSKTTENIQGILYLPSRVHNTVLYSTNTVTTQVSGLTQEIFKNLYKTQFEPPFRSKVVERLDYRPQITSTKQILEEKNEEDMIISRPEQQTQDNTQVQETRQRRPPIPKIEEPTYEEMKTRKEEEETNNPPSSPSKTPPPPPPPPPVRPNIIPPFPLIGALPLGGLEVGGSIIKEASKTVNEIAYTLRKIRF